MAAIESQTPRPPQTEPDPLPEKSTKETSILISTILKNENPAPIDLFRIKSFREKHTVVLHQDNQIPLLSYLAKKIHLLYAKFYNYFHPTTSEKIYLVFVQDKDRAQEQINSAQKPTPITITATPSPTEIRPSDPLSPLINNLEKTIQEEQSYLIYIYLQTYLASFLETLEIPEKETKNLLFYKDDILKKIPDAYEKKQVLIEAFTLYQKKQEEKLSSAIENWGKKDITIDPFDVKMHQSSILRLLAGSVQISVPETEDPLSYKDTILKNIPETYSKKAEIEQMFRDYSLVQDQCKQFKTPPLYHRITEKPSEEASKTIQKIKTATSQFFASPGLGKEVTLYIEGKKKLEDLKKAGAGTIPVYFPPKLPIVIKAPPLENVGVIERRLQVMDACQRICAEHQLSALKIPFVRTQGAFIIEERVPFDSCNTTEQIGLYCENYAKFDQAAKDFFHFSNIVEPKDTVNNLRFFTLTGLPRYDNIPLYVEGDMGKIGLIDTEQFFFKKQPLPLSDFLQTIESVIKFFPFNAKAIIEEAKKLCPHISLDEKKFETIATQYQELYTKIYTKHKEWLLSKKITAENLKKKKVTVDETEAAQIKKAFFQPIVSFCQGAKDSLEPETIKKINTLIEKHGQTIITLLTDLLNNALEKQQAAILAKIPREKFKLPQIAAARSIDLDVTKIFNKNSPDFDPYIKAQRGEKTYTECEQALEDLLERVWKFLHRILNHVSIEFYTVKSS